MPDLSGRFRIIRLDIEKDWQHSPQIAELIFLGERAANIRFKRHDEFVVATAGSFFLAQRLCNMAAVKAGIQETQREIVEIDLGPADVIAAVQGEPAHQFRVPLLDFAAFDAAPPPRGATLSLLWLLAFHSSDGSVPVREARLRFPMLNAAFDWLLESNPLALLPRAPRTPGAPLLQPRNADADAGERAAQVLSARAGLGRGCPGERSHPRPLSLRRRAVMADR